MGASNDNFSARERWEREQERLHGCRYVDGICTTHGTVATVQEAKLVCACRSFPYPHSPEVHDSLAQRFPGDSEALRFANREATDWRTPDERLEQGRPSTLFPILSKGTATSAARGGTKMRAELEQNAPISQFAGMSLLDLHRFVGTLRQKPKSDQAEASKRQKVSGKEREDASD